MFRTARRYHTSLSSILQRHHAPLSIVLLAILVSPLASAQFSGFGDDLEDASEMAIEVRAVLSTTSIAPGDSARAAIVVTVEPPWHINSARPYEDWLIPAAVEFESVDGLSVGAVDYPEGHEYTMSGMTMSVYSDRTVFPFILTVEPGAAPGEYSLPVSVSYQACNDTECRPPQTRKINLSLKVGSGGTPANEELFSAAYETNAGNADVVVDGGPQDENELQALIDKHGFWGYIIALGLAFLTGLLLSFSPCTYPMIPITVSVFAGQQRSIGRGFVMSLLYVGSMAVVYGVMGLIVSLVGGVFGAWLASPAVVIGIAVVFVVFSLSMFGLYELQVPASLRNRLGAAKSGGGVIGAIVLGIVAALVVSPCVGPFVAGILLYIATAGDPLIGFLVLFIFALGLGTLYVLIGTFSSAINALPNSGDWMESVKKFFGFVLLLMAVYFLRTIIPPVATALVTGLLLLSFGVFGGGLDRLTGDSRPFDRLKKLIGVIALIVGIYLFGGVLISEGLIFGPAREWLPAAATTGQGENEGGISWETDLDRALAIAAEQKRPVLVDTWATWCANCRVLEKKTFGNSAVVEAAARFVPVKVQLERAEDETTRQFMQRFQLRHYSLPTTLLIDSSGKLKRILQGVVEPDDMIREMQAIS